MLTFCNIQWLPVFTKWKENEKKKKKKEEEEEEMSIGKYI